MRKLWFFGCQDSKQGKEMRKKYPKKEKSKIEVKEVKLDCGNPMCTQCNPHNIGGNPLCIPDKGLRDNAIYQ